MNDPSDHGIVALVLIYPGMVYFADPRPLKKNLSGQTGGKLCCGQSKVAGSQVAGGVINEMVAKKTAAISKGFCAMYPTNSNLDLDPGFLRALLMGRSIKS
jgi:hypothetical protein